MGWRKRLRNQQRVWTWHPRRREEWRSCRFVSISKWKAGRGRSDGTWEVEGIVIDGRTGKDGKRRRSGWARIWLFCVIDERAGCPAPGACRTHLLGRTALKIKRLSTHLGAVFR